MTTSCSDGRCWKGVWPALYESALRFSSHRNVFRSHLKTFVLVFPDNRRINVEKPGGDFFAGTSEQALDLLRRFFVGAVVITRGLALPVLPMRNGMHRR